MIPAKCSCSPEPFISHPTTRSGWCHTMGRGLRRRVIKLSHQEERPLHLQSSPSKSQGVTEAFPICSSMENILTHSYTLILSLQRQWECKSMGAFFTQVPTVLKYVECCTRHLTIDDLNCSNYSLKTSGYNYLVGFKAQLLSGVVNLLHAICKQRKKISPVRGSS